MASCSAAEWGGWAELPNELLLMALERLRWAGRESVAVRLTSLRWRRIHLQVCCCLIVRRTRRW